MAIFRGIGAILRLYGKAICAGHKRSIREPELHERTLGGFTLAGDDIRNSTEPYALEGYAAKGCSTLRGQHNAEPATGHQKSLGSRYKCLIGQCISMASHSAHCIGRV